MSDSRDRAEVSGTVELGHEQLESSIDGGSVTPRRSTWKHYEGMAYMLAGEIFGAGMIGAARLLQNGTESKPGMATVQVSPPSKGRLTWEINHLLDHFCPL